MNKSTVPIRAIQDRAFVLHSVPYKETSLIVELFTFDNGRLPVIAKGAKRKTSGFRSILVSFQPLTVRYSGKSEVRTLQAAEWRGGHLPPEGKALFASFYLNELLMSGLKRDDPHPDLFLLYENALASLAQTHDLSTTVRRFELNLLAELGYGIDFSGDCAGEAFKQTEVYSWVDEQGWQSGPHLEVPTALKFTGDQLIRLGEGDLDSALAQSLRGFTRHLLNMHVAPNGLLSRTWMEQLIRYD